MNLLLVLALWAGALLHAAGVPRVALRVRGPSIQVGAHDFSRVLKLPSDPFQRQRTEKLVTRMLESPLARERAASYARIVAEPTELAFAPAQGHWSGVGSGSRILGILGWYNQGKVSLNSLYLERDHQGAEDDAVGVVAHELLGHGLGHESAEKFAPGSSWNYGRHPVDEATARLAGGVVEAELGIPLSDEYLKTFLRDPKEADETLAAQWLSYSKHLDADQLLDPVPVLQRRRERARLRMHGLQESLRDISAQRRFLDRLLAGGTPAEALATVRGRLDQRRVDLISAIEEDAKVQKSLQTRIDEHARPAPWQRPWLRHRYWDGDFDEDQEDVSRAFRTPFFETARVELARLGERLAALSPRFVPRVAPPEPGPGEMSMERFLELYKKSR
jgi:hypothetical protein